MLGIVGASPSPNLPYLYLKPDSDLPKKFCFICFIESPLKMMKNAFYFILKALFVLMIFKFLSLRFCHVDKTAGLERNLWRNNLVNKRLQYTYCQTSQDVKADKPWNLARFNKRNIFLQKSCRKWGRESSSIWGKSKWSAA